MSRSQICRVVRRCGTRSARRTGTWRSHRGSGRRFWWPPVEASCSCSGLVRQFAIPRVVIGEARTFHGGHDWLAEHGVEIVLLDDPECARLMADFITANPHLWFEDIGEGGGDS